MALKIFVRKLAGAGVGAEKSISFRLRLRNNATYNGKIEYLQLQEKQTLEEGLKREIILAYFALNIKTMLPSIFLNT